MSSLRALNICGVDIRNKSYINSSQFLNRWCFLAVPLSPADRSDPRRSSLRLPAAPQAHRLNAESVTLPLLHFDNDPVQDSLAANWFYSPPTVQFFHLIMTADPLL